MSGSKSKAVRRIIPVCIILLTLSACNQVNTNKIKLSRFESDLQESLSSSVVDKVSVLNSAYPDFLPIFSEHIIGIGKVSDPSLESYLNQFIGDPVIKEIYNLSSDLYADFDTYADQISEAINSFQTKTEEPELNSLTTFISGFNQSFVSLPNQLAIGIDNYLGSDCIYYKQLGLPKYIIEGMTSDFLVADATRAWIQSELDSKPMQETLLDNMIHEGIILYAAKAVLPKDQAPKLFHYSEDQWDWCERNEKMMWTFLVENELIYSSDPLLIRRLTGEAPFSRDFGPDSPPKAGSWIGYKIVSKMMSRQKTSLKDLVFKLSSTEILSLSAYGP